MSRSTALASPDFRRWTLVSALAASVAVAALLGAPAPALAAGALLCAGAALAFLARCARGSAGAAGATRTDPVTGCLDATGLRERLEAEIATGMRRGEPAALVLAELTEVPAGARGAELLRWAAGRLAQSTRPGDVLARLDGGEFALLLPATVKSDARAVAARALDDLRERGPAAVGVGGFPQDGAGAAVLWHHAREELRPGRAGPPAEPAAVSLSLAESFARAQDRRMTARHDHSVVVAGHVSAVARRLGWDDDELEQLRLAAFLHDVGKVAIPERVLAKPGPLTPAEFGLMAEHPAVGAHMLAGVEGLETVSEWVLRSHERFDGSGYPDGLAGEAIPQGSRILLVCDAFDAMVGPRPYQFPLGIDEALAELRRHAGTQFDPEVVMAFEAYVHELVASDEDDGSHIA